jgi:serine/threonine-protein kinase
MLGSTRFMAPEEFVLGAPIDESTTTFTLGRMISVFVGDGTLQRATFRGSDDLYALMVKACGADRRARFQEVAELSRHWRAVQ